MKRTAFEKEQIDGISRGTGANIKTQEHTEGAIHRGITSQHLPLWNQKLYAPAIAISAHNRPVLRRYWCCSICRPLLPILGAFYSNRIDL